MKFALVLVTVVTFLGIFQPAQADDLLHKTSVYGTASWSEANWVYLGLAPRATDPNRVRIVVSTHGFTARVTLEMTEKEVANYPRYLVARANKIAEIFKARKLSVTQTELLQRYANKIDQIQSFSRPDYQSGLELLKRNFPDNIFEQPAGAPGGIRVVAHFVYPITLPAEGKETAPKGTYRTYAFEERKALHQTKYIDKETGEEKWTAPDYVFGGFPAMWFYASTNGIGIHGPIRFSHRGEPNKATGKKQEEFWGMDEPGNFEYNKLAGINANIRWDLVRIKDSSGCIRSEVMEIRHLLPSSPDVLKQVPIEVKNDIDVVDVGGQKFAVNVNYYKTNPYTMSFSEAAWMKQWGSKFSPYLRQLKTFPYLDPSVIEFLNPNKSADLPSMTLLNQAPDAATFTM